MMYKEYLWLLLYSVHTQQFYVLTCTKASAMLFAHYLVFLLQVNWLGFLTLEIPLTLPSTTDSLLYCSATLKCRTDKSLFSLWIRDWFLVSRVLLLVPTASLLLHVWARNDEYIYRTRKACSFSNYTFHLWKYSYLDSSIHGSIALGRS